MGFVPRYIVVSKHGYWLTVRTLIHWFASFHYITLLETEGRRRSMSNMLSGLISYLSVSSRDYTCQRTTKSSPPYLRVDFLLLVDRYNHKRHINKCKACKLCEFGSLELEITPASFEVRTNSLQCNSNTMVAYRCFSVRSSVVLRNT